MNAEQKPLTVERLAEIRAGRTEYRTSEQLDADIADLLAEVERLQRTYTFDVAELRRQVADLTDQLAGARRTVDEQQDEIQQLRAARPSRAEVLREAADGVALEMVPETPGAGPGFLLAVRLIVRHLRQLADTAGSEGR